MKDTISLDRPGLGKLSWNYIVRFLIRPEAAPTLFLLLLIVVLGLTTAGFSAVANLNGILEQVAVVGIVALAVNQVILSAEIDVSTGSALAVCAFVYGNIAMQIGGFLIPLVVSLAVGGGIGLLNGIFITKGRIPSIITTLGMLFILRGVVLLVAASQVLNLSPESRALGLGSILGLNISIFILGVMYLTFEILNRHSTWGRNILAVGGNQRAARMVGLPLGSIKLWAFVATGLSCGLAAAVFLGQIGQLQATAATGFELRVIAAVVLGGTSITGGRGSPLAPVIGAVLVGVILNALTLNKVPGTLEQMVLGALILLAISFNALRHRFLGGLL